MNGEAMASKGTTPPLAERGRSVRQVFIDYIRRARAAYDRANVIQKSYLDNPQKYGGPNGATVACSEDFDWRQAVADEQFMERLANMYGQVVVLNTLERLLLEQQNTNQLLAHSILSQTDLSVAQRAETRKQAQNYLEALRMSRMPGKFGANLD